jgi:hypothetical protein|tara:strand:- start:243 stop:389 length:147 start_codon:yes stop_codon:yes gene_type:complete
MENSMSVIYIGTQKAQWIQAVSEAQERAKDPRMKRFWENTKQIIVKNY